MLSTGLKIIISAVVFCIGALMGAEFMRASREVARQYQVGTYKSSPQKRVQSISIIIVSALIGAIIGPLLPPLANIAWFGLVLAGGIIITAIAYILQRVMQ